MTMSSTITPDPTGTSATLANTFGPLGAAGDPELCGGTELVLSAAGLPYVEQAANTAVTAPRPAPTMTVRRCERKASRCMDDPFVGELENRGL